jgi:hypothetical protein
LNIVITVFDYSLKKVALTPILNVKFSSIYNATGVDHSGDQNAPNIAITQSIVLTGVRPWAGCAS